jgi:hypothetical protein
MTVFFLLLGVGIMFGGMSSGIPLSDQNSWLAWCMLLLIAWFLMLSYWHLWWRLHRREFDPAWRGVTRTTSTGLRVQLRPMLRMGFVWLYLLCALYCTLFTIGLVLPDGGGRDELFPSRGVLAGVVALVTLSAAVRAWVWPKQTGHLHDDEQAGTLGWRSWHPRGRERSVVRHWVMDV